MVVPGAAALPGGVAPGTFWRVGVVAPLGSHEEPPPVVGLPAGLPVAPGTTLPFAFWASDTSIPAPPAPAARRAAIPEARELPRPAGGDAGGARNETGGRAAAAGGAAGAAGAAGGAAGGGGGARGAAGVPAAALKP